MGEGCFWPISVGSSIFLPGEVAAATADSAAEKERRDTLVRLGSAEQKAQTAERLREAEELSLIHI